jgi:hypothetical protein
MILECDPHYNTQGETELLGEDEPGSTRISRPDDLCPPTLRDPLAATYDWGGDSEPYQPTATDRMAEYEAGIHADHCFDRDDE